jgi:hypothetical protein
MSEGVDGENKKRWEPISRQIVQLGEEWPGFYGVEVYFTA